MRYCTKCVLPETRPNIWFDDEGNCNCATSKEKAEIDWISREKEFAQLVEDAKSRSKGYDCLIPVSGGKDSTWQVIKCLEYGLRPLAVTWKTPVRTTLGQKNLDNLISLGVDHIDFQISPKVEKKFTLKTLKEKGSPAIPMHMALFSIPLNLACQMGIPYVVWGENSAFEYGGDEGLKGHTLNNDWLKKHGVTNGTTAKDWIDDDLTLKEMTPYIWPSDNELEEKNVKAVFLGHYFSWDPVETYRIAAEYGFEARKEGPKIGYYEFADIDDDFLISIHHFIKWYKFGFTRLWDNLSLEIRNGRMTREKAIGIIKAIGDQTPKDDIKNLCQYLEISSDEFFEIMEKFRNKNVWTKDNGIWEIKDFLVPNWEWR